MLIMTVEEAQAKLSEIIARLAPGEEVVLTHDSRPVAKLVGQSIDGARPVLGRGKGKVIIVAEDDEHLKGFEEYTS